jgi:hypothetical protein
MGIFGWSYPPGCNGPPNDDEGPCMVCGKELEDCICPECPVCGYQGDETCYFEHGMVRSQEQTDSFKATEQIWAERVASEKEYGDEFKREREDE